MASPFVDPAGGPSVLATGAALFRALGNYPDAAILGFLRREHLSEEGLREDWLDRIELALQQGLSPDRLQAWLADLARIDKAVDWISDFRVKLPIVKKFCRLKDLPLNNLPVMIADIQHALYREDFALSDWVDYLDQHREHGRQHLFLLRLGRAHRDYLSELRDPGSWRRILRAKGCEARLDEPLYVLDAPEPVLSAVRHSAEPPAYLSCKWVWARPSGRRSVQFFHLDLESGEAELRIEKLPGGGRKQVLEQLEICRALLAHLVDLEKFEPILQEPVMRRLFGSPELALSSWEIRLAHEVNLRGRSDPRLLDLVKLAFRQFFVLEIKGKWTVPHAPSPLTVEMDGRTDALTVFGECSPEPLGQLLGRVRKLSRGGRSRPAPAQEGSEPAAPELQTIAAKLYGYLRQTGESRIEATRLRRIAQELALSAQQVNRALRAVDAADFGGRFLVVCPQNGRPARSGGKVLEYRRLQDVPPQVQCENGGASHLHETADTVLLELGKAPDEPPGELRVFRFLLYFVPLALLTTWGALALSSAYAGFLHEIFITVAWAVCLLAEMAAAIRFQGREQWETALSIFLKLWKAAVSVVQPAKGGTEEGANGDSTAEES